MKGRLNKRAIDEAVYEGPGSCYLWDTELVAFGLRIYPTGRKSFVVSYWSRGKRRFFVLGQYASALVRIDPGLLAKTDPPLTATIRLRRG